MICGIIGPEMGRDILFWGEWEPQSRAYPLKKNQNAEFPKFLYEPYYIYDYIIYKFSYNVVI